MLDIKFIRENPDTVKSAAKNKGLEIDIERLLELDNKRRLLQGEVDALNRERNLIAKKGQGGQDDVIRKGRELKNVLAGKERELREVEREFKELMYKVPNVPTEDTPIGPDDAANKVLREVGDKPKFNFKPKAHWELGTELGLIDNETAAEVAGARFTYLKNEAVFLEFALIQYALSVLTNNKELLSKIAKEAGLNIPVAPFTPVIPPIFIKEEIYNKMARLEPREDRYHIEGTDKWLIGSAEHTLGPMHTEEVLMESGLPLRYVGFSACLRQEAGTYGKDTKGIIRLHQFDKLEMESFSTAESALSEHNFMIAIQEYLMQSLNIPYRVVLKSTGEIGLPNARGVDIEAWMPGESRYMETHTADYMGDYQARRLNTRVRHKDGSIGIAHMNDATVFAAGRTISAILENYQTESGNIKIPEALQPFMFGIGEIKR